MVKILIVEDDENMRILLEAKLKKEYEVFLASNGKKALELLDNIVVDMMLVDVMMPVMDGYELMTRLRNDNINIPAIMITAKNSIGDKLKGFNVGVDDYMTKPIDFDELDARIKAILRRNKINRNKEIHIGQVIINSANLTLKRGNKKLYLPQKEFQLLFQLLSYPDIIFTKDELLDTIWGMDSSSDETTIRTHVNRLRDKVKDFEEFEIQTIRGLGYKGVIKYEKE